MSFLKSLWNKLFGKVEKPVDKVENNVEPIEIPEVKKSWYDWAFVEKGTSESKNPDRVKWYHSFTKLDPKYWKPETSWCASFISTALVQTGFKSPRTAWARDFLNYGLKLTKPVPHCIMVFERNGPGGDSHVTLWTGKETTTHYECCGGNQNNAVSIAWYAKKDLLGARWPVEEFSSGYKANWDHLPQGAEWTYILKEAIEKYGQEMLKVSEVKDDKLWNEKFNYMSYAERVQFFIMLISSMVEFESNFKPDTVYEEGFNDSQGNKVLSRGLLQISKESANQSAYKGNIQYANDLHDVKINLETGVKILNYWIPKDLNIGSGKLGGARYWSVLRDTSKSQAKIRAKTKSL